MSRLQRQIKFLFDQIDKGSLQIVRDFAESETGKQLTQDLAVVKQRNDGSIDLSTCSPLVKSIAKTAFFLNETPQPNMEQSNEPILGVSAKEIRSAMVEYFQLLEEFFIKMTGNKAEYFDSQEYRSRILSNSNKQADKVHKTWMEYIPKIQDFHTRNTHLLLKCSGSIGGLKCVLGGTSRFTESAFRGVRKFALYADTVFIPDPVLPWIEVDRADERFPIIELMLACQTLLLLKPLIDADLSYPAIIVFPSWEKSLEAYDVTTQDGISELILNFFSHYLNCTFEDEQELILYVDGKSKDDFINKVNHYKLFWPPEQASPLTADKAVPVYMEWLKTWRSKDWLASASLMSHQRLILNGIFERLTPQFHVRDNATNFDAQPLFCLQPNFYYFSLTSQAGNDRLRETGFLKLSNQSVLQSLLQPQIAWLGNIPIEEIARLRQEGCNEKFRLRLSTYTNELHNAAYEEIDKVVSSVMRGIRSLLDDHDREAHQIAEKYERRHLETLGMSILTTAVALFPGLDPWFGLSILAPLGKMAKDVFEQARDEKALSRSLTGVLSTTEQQKST
ncbi:MAG: hypothetical protein HY781_12045 [Chloroflexi bacterium]|nr:hypothetical protein [Chloroflexota bacterium]